jgi:Tetratricopeptide repeat
MDEKDFETKESARFQTPPDSVHDAHRPSQALTLRDGPRLPRAIRDSTDAPNHPRTIIICLDGTGDRFDGDNSDYFQILKDYSLVQWKDEQQSYAMHKLVHAWGYDRLAEDEKVGFTEVTFQLVVKAVDNCGGIPRDKLRLVQHIMANFSLLVDVGSSRQSAVSAVDELERIGRFLSEIGRYSEGRVLKEFVLNERTRLLCGEHLDTIVVLNNLALTPRDLGQHADAAAMLREVVEKRKRILGDEHPDTISA